ncbi:hypothetical protein [Massilia sp. TS11]|uniref:hypothetical protein n=1 Tax=Massilia sp. TS11 TaxID=2908003 RepID=UPI001EDC629E|nr:hypothetical protein [Massilia sp. TS11]MCG2584435.1 hypothetical protein [Massilia sp. TS11]
MQAPAPAPGLSSAAEVEQLADQLSQCANALHDRIVQDIHAGKLGLDPARTLFDDEVLLRQRANALYAEAAKLAVSQLATSQQHLMDLTRAAEEKIRTVDRIAAVAGLASSVLGLAGAALSGKPQTIIKALEGVYHATQAVEKSG